MNTPISIRATAFNNLRLLVFILPLFHVVAAQADWKIKFDRESTDMRGDKSRPFILESDLPSTPSLRHQRTARPEVTVRPPHSATSLLNLTPVLELSVVMTPEGFFPEKLYLRKGETYQITIVNVSKDFKNSSFVIPSLSVYEGAYFADPQTIEISAGEEGLFLFLSPESGARGELVVYESNPAPPAPLEPIRLPASFGRE